MKREERLAQAIIEGFETYWQSFYSISDGAPQRFVEADWPGSQKAARERTALYNRSIVAFCEKLSGGLPVDWRLVRQHLASELAGRFDAPLVKTFYNSIFRKLNGRLDLDDARAFVSGSDNRSLPGGSPPIMRYSTKDFAEFFRQILRDSALCDCLTDIDQDALRLARRLREIMPDGLEQSACHAEMLTTAFYRNKGAYLMGRFTTSSSQTPFALSVGHVAGKVLVDALIWGEDRLSILFSFTRAYFMVSDRNPIALAAYLGTMLPAKKSWELLSAIGFFKHGKTEFVRGYREHLEMSDDQFLLAEGIKGQVMVVFYLPSYQVVFKVIKDRFPATKKVTPGDVKKAYQLVKSHDRVGRMADTQEFHEFSFPVSRFAPEVLDELHNLASDSFRIEGQQLIVRHLYAERLMTPLNLYIQTCSEPDLRLVLTDYGDALKDLAAANIFPGDMLLKNFGVTRHGRVVFYDYDEICYLTEIAFRSIPGGDNGDSLSAEPWFDVAEYDVFPEEFSTFLFPDEKLKERFSDKHADLFTVSGWQAFQDQLGAGVISDVLPYPPEDRLVNSKGD